MDKVDTNKSLEQLVEQERLPQVYGIGSHVETECVRLKKVPIKNLEIEDLRLLILQRFCPEIIVPLAFDILELNPLAEGSYYKGDLLVAVLSLPNDFWLINPSLNNRLVEIKVDLENIYETIQDDLLPNIAPFDWL